MPERNDLHMMYLVYNICNHPGEQIHGNSKRPNQPSEQLWLKRLLFKKGLNIAIAKDLKTIDAENLLDLQVIQNSKYMYNHNKRQRPPNSNFNNMADDIQTILTSLQQNYFNRCLDKDNKPPNIITLTNKLKT